MVVCIVLVGAVVIFKRNYVLEVKKKEVPAQPKSSLVEVQLPNSAPPPPEAPPTGRWARCPHCQEVAFIGVI